jgi:hypothetical protein
LAQTKAYVDNLFHAADEATAEQGSRMELLETLNGIIVDNARELSKQGSVPDEVHRLLTRPLGDIPKDQRFPPAASRRIVLPEGP